MEIRRSTPSSVVPELLTEYNYKTWRVYMKNYLSSEGLWSIVSGEESLGPSSSEESTRKNAAALHAIVTSCGPDAFGKIYTASSAKYAWEVLLKTFRGEDGYQAEQEEEDPTFQDGELLERHQTRVLINAIRMGSLADVEEILNSGPRWGARISKNGYTALHAAISSGPQGIANRLIEEMSLEQLEIRDKKKRTALALAAHHGKMETARRLIGKHPGLLFIKDSEGNIPLLAACQGGHVETTLFLWYELRNDLTENDEGRYRRMNDVESNEARHHRLMNDAASFLQACIKSKMFDIALDVLRLLPRRGSEYHCALYLSLAEIPSAFSSGSRLVFWQRLIYNNVVVVVKEERVLHMLENLRRSDIERPNEEHIDLEEQSFQRRGALETAIRKTKSLIASIFSPALETAIRKTKSLIASILQPGKHIYELKMTHAYAFKTLRHLCWNLSKLEHNQIVQSGAVRAMFTAIKNGIVEFVKEIINTNPDIIWMHEESTSRDILMCAIAYRQEKIASFIYGLDEWRDATVNLDKDRNNLLHMAGKLAPDFQLSRISGAALQMQRELQWFKEVESIVPQYYKESKNDFRKTPGQVFSEEHKDLQRKAEDWMKQTASSYTVVGALIITVMFAAAFTIPGGNIQDKGFPIFLHKTLFKIFVISDAVSLSAATTSVLMFLGILTSRYAEGDFLESLPRRLIIGLSTLFISISVMMVAFSAALVIMLEGRLWIIIVMVVLASIPIIFFAFLQFPLLVEIFNSTYRWKVFKKK